VLSAVVDIIDTRIVSIDAESTVEDACEVYLKELLRGVRLMHASRNYCQKTSPA
jgi:hypothetical protein